MIELHRLDNTKLMINVDQIESIEEIPDTVITLNNGKKYVMKEDAEDIVAKIVKFKNEIWLKRLSREGKFRIRDNIKIAVSN
ncbi:MAG: flagellar FlbD family protein [Actinobacteria bacterium]|nr:flagellar FlbD family protein [Actinomycetota bacterium]